MKLKSAAGMVCYVRDLDKTVEFYEKLGFQFKARDPGRATAYLNWWWFDFDEADAADAHAWHVSPNVNNAEPRRAVLLQR
jgi:catechol 2,3-dioxygenase-like lactoylglutathione lyase family enzyme